MRDRTMDPGFRIQTGASRLVFHGDLLAQAAAKSVRLLDAHTLTVKRELPLVAHGLGFLRDGALAVVTAAADDALSLHRVDTASGADESFPNAGRLRGARIRVLPAAKPDEVYLAYGWNQQVTRYKLAHADGATALWPTASLDIGDDEQSTLIEGGGADGLVYAKAGSFVQVAPGQGDRLVKNPDSWVKHLARGPAGKVWYSKLSTVGLATLEEPVRVEHRVDLAPATIVHLHADAGAAAVLIVEAQDPAAPRWFVAAIDPSGKVAWRAPVAAPTTDDVFVAASKTRVVLGGAGELLAWDAATGKKIK